MESEGVRHHHTLKLRRAPLRSTPEGPLTVFTPTAKTKYNFQFLYEAGIEIIYAL